jgi:two-component system, response regulator YesN
MMERHIFLENGELNLPLISKTIDAFSYSTDISVTVFDANMDIVLESLKKNKICSFFNVYNQKQSVCGNNLAFSSELAAKLGESYIFACPSGFVNIAVAILEKGAFAGAFIAGPIAMGPIVEDTVNELFIIHGNSTDVFSKVTLFLRNMKIYTPTQVNHLGYLLYSCMMSLYNCPAEYEKANLVYREQVKIGEDIHQLKKMNVKMVYPYDKEKELIKKVKMGDSEGTNEIFRSLLNEVLLIEGGNIEVIKARVLEICAILSRASVEGGASLQKIFGINFDLINSLNAIETIQGIIDWSAKITDHFVQNVFGNLYSGNSYLIGEALQHINTHYMNKITLEKVSGHLHINPSYLSKLFKQEMKTTFTQYLNQVRITKGQELLKDTDMEIMDIALYVGYEDQSYFTKVFKKMTGTTPLKYRKI